MEDTLNLPDYSQFFSFGFFDSTGRAEPLDPRIGSFSLSKTLVEYDTAIGMTFKNVDIPLISISELPNGIIGNGASIA